MTHKLTKLSNKDSKILSDIYNALEKILLPTTYQKTGGQGHQVRTGATKQKGARQALFGIRNFRKGKQYSKYYRTYPHIIKLFNEFISSHYPDFKFDSVYVNKNVVCKKHLDSNNVGKSILVGLGPYTKGRLILYINGKEKKFHIKSQSIMFNGSEIEHRSETFNGTRYSLVFFRAEKISI